MVIDGMDMVGTAPSMITTFITYYPDDRFRSQLIELLNNNISVVVYDNTPGKDAALFALQFSGLSVLGEGQNLGLGQGLQRLMTFVRQRAYTHALYFDQDTIISTHTLTWIEQWLTIRLVEIGDFAGIQFTSERLGLSENASPQELPLIINSGTLFNLEKYEKMGGHDSSLFVECVDYKFCQDAAYHGFKLGMAAICPDIDHHSLQPVRNYKLGSFRWNHRQYPWRRHVQFIKTLLKLSWIALGRGQWRYAFIFLRNVCTHLISQATKGLISRFLRPS